MVQYIKEILFLLGNDLKVIPVVLIFFVINSLFDLIGISIVGPYVSTAINETSSDNYSLFLVRFFEINNDKESILVFFGVLLVIIFILKAFISILLNWFIIRFSQRLQIKIRTFLMQSYQEMPYAKYLSRNSSEYIVNIQDLTGKYQAIVLASLRMLSDIFVSLFILIFLAYQNPLGLLFLVLFLATFIFFYDRTFKGKMLVYGEKANLALDFMIKGIQQGIYGIKEITILNKESYFLNKVRRGAEDLAFYQTWQLVISTSPRFLLEAFLIIFIVSFIYLGMVSEGGLESIIPVLAIFVIASLRLLPAANSISTNLSAIRYGRNAVSRLYDDYFDLVKSNKIKTSISSIQTSEFHNLSLRHVSFSYNGSANPDLVDISMDISSGKSIGIMGPSGSGKSTLINVILGFLKPQEGKVLINEEPLDGNLLGWRSKVGYIPQDTFLIDASLKENIILGSQLTSETDQDVIDSIKKAQLSDFLYTLPQGLETEIGERGLRLSGGQKQRLALARTFYHNREILVLDEATSALDNATEQEIVTQIEQLKGKKTMIIIAHRLSTIKDCDYIYQLESGRIVNHGKPEDMFRG